jgi:hypothetical protein
MSCSLSQNLVVDALITQVAHTKEASVLNFPKGRATWPLILMNPETLDKSLGFLALKCLVDLKSKNSNKMTL